MGLALRKTDERYTYADYRTWDGGERYEIIDGGAYMMASPTVQHQLILMDLSRQFATFLLGKPCRVFSAPLDVFPFAGEDDDLENEVTVVQPDLMVVCDRDKLKDSRGVRGAPDLVVEILSPSNSRYDRKMKFNLYQEAGVREYWIVDPDRRTVCAYTLEDGRYHAGEAYAADAKIPVGVLEGCAIDLASVFPA